MCDVSNDSLTAVPAPRLAFGCHLRVDARRAFCERDEAHVAGEALACVKADAVVRLSGKPA
jgi:hypothetical protein